MCVSAKFRPARVTWISTSPEPGTGTGSSASCSTSGPPNSVIWIARTCETQAIASRRRSLPAARRPVL